ncbi:hypothetical protein D9M69_581670 [compost metagenome]
MLATGTERHVALDLVADVQQAVGQILRLERQTHGVHAAPEVHTNGSGNDRLVGRDHAADGRPLASMHVRHQGDTVASDERQASQVLGLLQRLVLNVVGPNLDGARALFLDDLLHRFSLQ